MRKIRTKKLIVGLLVVIMIMSLIGCGKSKNDGQQESQMSDEMKEAIEDSLTEQGVSDDAIEDIMDEQKTEEELMKKDNSSMTEISNAVQIAITYYEDVYKEILPYIAYGNVSCYTDSSNPKIDGAEYVVTREADDSVPNKVVEYTYSDEARMKKYEEYVADGNMCGITITFEPQKTDDGDTVLVMKDGIVNKYIEGIGENINIRTDGRIADIKKYNDITPSDFAFESLDELYNKVRGTIGNDIEIKSNTLKGATYTIFISVNPTQTDMEAATDNIKVYGQWNMCSEIETE